MSNLSDFQYPPPKNWQDFESLCRDLWAAIWNDPNTQKNGRSGQEQHGVDVYGQPNQGQLWAGVQCKGKDNNLGKSVTEKELKTEVEKAKKFTPSLSSWTLATTAPRDAKIQQKAREITEKHRKQGLFTVDVWSWEDIIEQLVNYPSLIAKYLPQINNLTPATTQKIDDIDFRTQKIDSNLSDQTGAITDLSRLMAEFAGKINAVQGIGIQDFTGEHNAVIDDIRELVNERQYKDAIKAFERLKKRIWLNASDKVKYRILTNMGDAYYRWGKLDEAGPLFIEAYQYNPDDEHALTNLSIAYSFQSNFEKTEEYARRVLEKNPASINGYSILLQIPPYKNSFDEALKLVPESFRTKPLIAFCLGLAAQNENRFEVALEWFEIALANDTENSPDFKSYVAVMLMQSLWTVKSPLLLGQVSEESRRVLERAIQLLTEAWEQIENTDLRESHPLWILNRGIAQKLLGNNDEAFEDIKTAHDINPSDPEATKHLALILLKKQDTAGTGELLEKIRNNRDIPEISTILADIYNSRGENEKAVTVINDFLEWNEDQQLKFLSYKILVDAYLELDDKEKAQIYSDKLLEEFPDVVSAYVSAARVSRKKNNDTEAVELLMKGKGLISEETHITELVELGDEFFYLHLFKEAAECYEAFTDIEQDTWATLRLLVNYYNAGILSKALHLCRVIRDKRGILFKHTEIEIAILEEINDLPASKNLSIEYLKEFPDNLAVKLRLARLNYLSGNFSELDRFLSEDIDYSTLSLENGMLISSFLALVDGVKESFDLMYELRRKYFQEGEAHSFYLTNFLMNDLKVTQWLDSESVTVNSAVCLERVDGNREWYVIEDRPDADFQKREFHTSHPFVQDLLGKKVGDKVQLKKSAHNEEYSEIVEIKSKYVYALHETMQNYETMFPDRNDFWSIHIKKQDADQEGNSVDIEKIRNILAARSKMVNEVMNLYQTTGLTVGVVAELLGWTALEAWDALLTNPRKLTFCSNGDQSILDYTVSILSKDEPPKLAADITSIHLAFLLKVQDKIIAHFGKLLIAPTTLFSLYRKYEEIKKNRGKGRFSLVESDGVLYKNEVTPEEVEKHIAYLEELIDWIENNCETSPHQIGFDIERNYKAQLKETLMPEFFDTSLIVKNEEYLLFSEDERLGQVSRSELGVVHRAWMQPVLMALKNKGVISKGEYTEAIIMLASTNLTHIHLDYLAILEAARKSDWLPETYYLNVVKGLQGGRADIYSATDVALNFLVELDNLFLPSGRQQSLIGRLLSHLTYNRNLQQTLNLLQEKVIRRLHYQPIKARRILIAINTWKKYRLITG